MRFLLSIAGISFWIWCVFTYPTIGINLSSDVVYFPDQLEYAQMATKCPDNMILWPGTRRCYREGEQGPCNFDRVLTLDRKFLKPYCKDV